ncbi:MAG: hypothetical protein IKF41_03150 [Alphaproteobacteria bacterium]|nr:hypothetical protein [Alphaproteobacteria bacterium]
MKKLLGISLVAILTAAPMMAGAAVGDVVAGDPGSTASGAASATNPPKYALATSTANDGKVATAGYVKGAYNAAIKAVNKLQDTKQDTISDLATIRSNASAGANALQKADITTGSANGTISVKGTDVSVKGLGSAAYTASTAYASSAQGTKADSALQTAGNGLTKSGTTVSADLTDKGGLEFAGTTDGSKTISVKVDGTTIEKNTTTGALQVKSGTYATAAQGAKADTALQPTSALDGAKLTAGTVAKTALASGVQTSLDLADSAVQSVVEGTANGTIAVDGTDVAVHGLGSAAYTASNAYATAAQGTKADNAIQSAGNGLSKDGTTLAVKAKSGGGITVDTNGVSLTNGIQAAAAPTTYTGTGLTTKGYVDEKVATATSGMVTASSTNTFTNKTIDAEGTGNSITNLKTTNFKSGTIVTSVGATGADTSLPTEKAVRSAITTATSSMAKQAGVVETIKDVTLTSSLASTAITGTVATVTDWTSEAAGTAQVTGSVTSGTVNTSINSASVKYTES